MKVDSLLEILKNLKEIRDGMYLPSASVQWVRNLSPYSERDSLTYQELVDRRIEEFTLLLVKQRLLHGTQTFQAPASQPQAFREI